MKIIPTALVGAVAAGAMAMVPTAAAAQSRYYERDRGISVGDIIAGAVVIGGIAAVAGAIGRNNSAYRYDDRYYRDGRYDYYNGNPRTAVEQCVNAASRDARARGYRFAQVTQIRDVNDTRNGWRVRGSMVVDGSSGYYGRAGYDRYDRGRYQNVRDSGTFTCHVDRGRISRLDYSGIRGL